MTVLSATAIVVSRHRPELLQRCLRALGQQLFDSYEVVVVADFESLKSLEIDYPYKAIAFDEANISRARNLGIEQAAGDFVAFIDDDAVAEPTWLHHLALGFALPEVNAVGGYVRSRNGFSFQWKANCITPLGFSEPLEIAGVEPTVPPIPQGCAVKTEGTNCAFRREILSNIGGFDENIAFFHDETDLNMRLHRCITATPLLLNAVLAVRPKRCIRSAFRMDTSCGNIPPRAITKPPLLKCGYSRKTVCCGSWFPGSWSRAMWRVCWQR